MWFFGRKKWANHELQKEAEIQNIRKETFKQIDNKVQRLDDTNQKMGELLTNQDLGVTGNIFLATGGDKRRKKNNG